MSILRISSQIMLATSLTILQVYARIKKRRFMQWTKKVPVTNRPSLLVL